MNREHQSSPPQLEPELRDLLDDYRDAVDMPDAAFERGLARVEATATGAGGTSLGSGPSSGLGGWVTVAAVGVAAIGVVAVVVAMSGGATQYERVAAPSLPIDAGVEPGSDRWEHEMLAAPLAPPPPAPAPAPAPGPTSKSSPPRAKTGPAVAVDADSLARETKLLRSAQSALNRDQHEAALASVRAHAKAFPNGVLAEERRALEVVALCADGQLDRGRTQARAFVRTFPNSTSKARVLSACSSP